MVESNFIGMNSILVYLCALCVIPHFFFVSRMFLLTHTDDDVTLKYQQFVREEAKEHRLFLENSFDKLLLLISGGTFLFGSILTWMNYRTKNEITAAVSKKFNEQIEALLGTKFDELRNNLDYQDNELKKRMETADKLILELSAKISQTTISDSKEATIEYSQRRSFSIESDVNRILWVDDMPDNNKRIINMFSQGNVIFELVKSTAEAGKQLAKKDYVIIISDMKRGDSPDEGLKLLKLRNEKCPTVPFIIYSSSKSLAGYAHTAKSEGATLVTTKVTDLLGCIQSLVGKA